MVQAAKAGNNNAIKYVASAYEEGLALPKIPPKPWSGTKKFKAA